MTIIKTKKKNVQPRLVINGTFRFVGRLFGCPTIADKTAVLVAFDSQRDTVVDLFAAETGESLGIANVLEVSHG